MREWKRPVSQCRIHGVEKMRHRHLYKEARAWPRRWEQQNSSIASNDTTRVLCWSQVLVDSTHYAPQRQT